jgi:hypothetical protein
MSQQTCRDVTATTVHNLSPYIHHYEFVKPEQCKIMQIKLLLRVYQSARGLFFNDNLGISAACLIIRVVDFFNLLQRCGSVM